MDGTRGSVQSCRASSRRCGRGRARRSARSWTCRHTRRAALSRCRRPARPEGAMMRASAVCLAVLALTACARATWTKDGMTDQEYYEEKVDGWRMPAYKRGDRVRL